MAVKKILKYLQDSERPSLGITIKIFKACLFWAPNRNTQQSFLYHTVLIFAITAGLNQLIYMGIKRRPEMLVTFLQFSAYHMGVVKFLTYEIYHKKWENIINTISEIEKDELEDVRCRKIVTKYISYSHSVVLCFWILGIITNITFFYKRWLQILQEADIDDTNGISDKVFYFWWPSDLGGRWNMYLYMFLQNLYADIGTIYVLAWDALCMMIFIVFAGQMKVVATRLRHALEDNERGELQMKIKLIEHHKQYLSLLELQQSTSEALSPALFIHLLIISVNIGVIISYMGSYSRPEFLTALLFVVGLYIQLFLYYWHGNEVTVQSELVSNSVLESDWVNKSYEIKKLIVLISITTRKKLVFFAGPFNTVSLSTFAAIVRASYTFYTIMAETK